MSRASVALPLREWYVISLRPQHQHGSLRRAAAKLGAATFALSSLRLERLAAEPALTAALHCSQVIVTSPAAVQFAQRARILRPRRGQRWFAVGPGSAAALRRVGIEQVVMPEQATNSEALLAHPELAQVRGEAIGLITAPAGRGILKAELQARGAKVVVAEVYRRVAVKPSAARLRALAALPNTTALLVSSGEALSALAAALDPQAWSRLGRRPCVVASERLAALARAAGFQTVIVAESALPAALMAALARYVATGGFR